MIDERFYKYMVYIKEHVNFPVYSTLRWQNELPNADVISVVDGLNPDTSYTFLIGFFLDVNISTYGRPYEFGLTPSKEVEATTSKFIIKPFSRWFFEISTTNILYQEESERRIT